MTIENEGGCSRRVMMFLGEKKGSRVISKDVDCSGFDNFGV